MSDDAMALSRLFASSGQPQTVFEAFDAITKRLVGHELLTMLYVDGSEVARIYSNQPAQYPVFGRKLVAKTPWGDHVLTGRRSFLGRDKASIRWAFSDHVLIESMGLGSVINVPALYNGETIGTINLLAPEGFYREEHVAPIEQLAPLLVPAFLAARAAAHIV